MRFATVLASLGFSALALAQNNGTNSTVVTINVGGTASTPNGGIFQFIPNNVKASNGTVIRFMFTGMPGNHSITQSSFSAPCVDLAGGFDSGWVSIPTNGVKPVPEWNLTITDDSKPLWFFCKQLVPAPHCPVGMVGAINAPASGNNTFDAYKKAASAVKQVDQTENGIVGQGASASQRPSPITNGASAFPDVSVTAAPSNPASGASGAPSPTKSSAASSDLVTMNSGLVALVAGAAAMFLA